MFFGVDPSSGYIEHDPKDEKWYKLNGTCDQIDQYVDLPDWYRPLFQIDDALFGGEHIQVQWLSRKVNYPENAI